VSFRSRLTIFFLLIVVLPMIAVAVLVLEVSGDSETGKADARLSASLDTAVALYNEQLEDTLRPLREVAADERLIRALESEQQLEDGLTRELAEEENLDLLVIRDADGRELASVGEEPGFGVAQVKINGADGRIGSVLGSIGNATAYVSEVRAMTGRDAVLQFDGETATTLPLGEVELPAAESAATIEVDGDEKRAASVTLFGGVGMEPTLTLIGPLEEGGLAGARPFIVGVLAVFFLIALAFITVLLRALHGQTSAMLAAARRIGGGDFSQDVPVEGNDEMAGLALEFNKMSDRLSAQMDELRQQRVELEDSVRRIGNAFASGLDRAAVLEIVAETAISACDAEYARITLPGQDSIEVGTPPEGERVEATESTGATAITIMRERQSFSDEQRGVLRYLAAQASTSIENIALHEQVSQQAVTDELTGLANNRALRRWMDNESERAERFGHPLSLLMVDLDDFKAVNDTYGHLQGDEVLRALGRILRRESRGIDEPARYGGEEFAVGLPETGAEGALEVAERVRARIAAQEIPLVDGDGSIAITASIGVATFPVSAGDVRSLFSAADDALYRAKRSGKNRVEIASALAGAGAKGPEDSRRR
jgi:diguanylate cyclase (GGDEF)-like protein